MEEKLNLEPLFKEADVARILNRSIKTLRKDRLFGRGPRYLRMGRSVRYRPRDVEDFLNRCPSGGSPVHS
jgi:hypothetical protein